MKNSKIFSTAIIIILSFLSCKAQTEIAPLNASSIGQPDGVYYKDTFNELDKYEGTWRYQDSNTIFIITLEKKEMVYYDTYNEYSDDLYGEYKYIENGEVIINTLPELEENPEVGYRNIGGNYLTENNEYILCDDCEPGEKRVTLYFNDPERDYLNASMVLQFIQEEEPLLNQEGKIKVTIIGGETMLPDENSPTETRVPYGEYIMVKQ